MARLFGLHNHLMNNSKRNRVIRSPTLNSYRFGPLFQFYIEWIQNVTLTYGWRLEVVGSYHVRGYNTVCTAKMILDCSLFVHTYSICIENGITKFDQRYHVWVSCNDKKCQKISYLTLYCELFVANL